MNVYGVEFSDELLAIAWDKACEVGLSYHTLQAEIAAQGYSHGEAVSRAADRLLQKKRKAGVSRYVNGNWELT